MTDATQPHHLPPHVSSEQIEPPTKTAQPKRYLSAVIAGVAGLIIGASVAFAILAPPMTEATAKSERLSAELERTESELNNARGLNTELMNASAEVDAAAEELAAREAAVQEREDAVTAAEETIAANSFGDGMYVVGVDVTAGQYRNEGSAGCYYAWMSSSASDADIIDNELTDGPSTVTLRNGENFESNGCGTWKKIG